MLKRISIALILMISLSGCTREVLIDVGEHAIPTHGPWPKVAKEELQCLSDDALFRLNQRDIQKTNYYKAWEDIHTD